MKSPYRSCADNNHDKDNYDNNKITVKIVYIYIYIYIHQDKSKNFLKLSKEAPNAVKARS